TQEAHEDEGHRHVEGVVPGRENAFPEDRKQPELDQVRRNRNRARGLDLARRALGRQLRPPGDEIKVPAGAPVEPDETLPREEGGLIGMVGMRAWAKLA
ncbi:MAG TPA: hypothetical protein VKI41_14340, partial [Vicinamibacteria bacterium]|nr:hypothetical protein [Vicinamibacteria bacterium]